MPTVFQQNDTDCSLFRAATKDRDMCPLCNSESQSLSDFLDDLEPVQILMAKKLSGTNNFTRKRDSV